MATEIKSGKKMEKKIRIRIIGAVLLAILGFTSACAGIYVPAISDGIHHFSEMYVGIGCGLVAGGIIKVIRNVRLLKNKNALKEREIFESDERNRLIGLKSWSYSGYVMFVLLYIALLVAGAVNELIMCTILVILGVFAVCLLVTKCILAKIM